MATNLHIDEKLLAKAVEMGGHKPRSWLSPMRWKNASVTTNR